MLPTPRHSRWFTHWDWYLNWQMCKGLGYGGLHLPPETHRVAEEYGVGVPRTASARGGTVPPLLIASQGRLPAAQCLVLDGADDLKSWLASARRLADDLRAADVRVYLPEDSTVKEAEKLWKSAAGPDTPCTVHFTRDLEAPR